MPTRVPLVAILLSVAVLVVSASSAMGAVAERYCGTRHGDEIHARKTSCRKAREVAKAVRTLPPEGNGPGSPAGWSCHRDTGGIFGVTCDGNHAATVSILQAPSGPATRRTGVCDQQATWLAANYTIGNLRARGMTCAVAIN